MHSELELRQALIEAGRRMYQRQMVASNDGNLSCRLSESELLITPTGVCKGDLTPDSILKVDRMGRVLSGTLRPTSEMKMHLAVYDERPDVQAVVHAHPQVATAFAAARLPMEEITLPEVVFALKRIALVEYATPSTQQLPNAVKRHIQDADALLLSNHGALTVGRSVMDAYFNMETLEHFASISLYARALGGAKALNAQQVEALFGVRRQVFEKQ